MPNPAPAQRREPGAQATLAARRPICEQAKSASPRGPVFTNCGDADSREVPVEPAKKLTRVPFKVSRLMEFCTRRELVAQIGHNEFDWPLVILKELNDNALDDAEEAGIAPVIAVTVKAGAIIVRDNGTGIPADTIKGVLDYSIRVSSREAYVSPTRGAQGNVLKTLLPMAYVLNEGLGDDAYGETVIEAHGIAHHIRFSVDHIRQEPKIQYTSKPSPIVNGTKIKVQLPTYRQIDLFEYSRDRFLALAESYAWLNPHLRRAGGCRMR
jgi:DNA topoisomerase VI subunit B